MPCGKMAMPLSSLSSHISLTMTHHRSHHLALNAYVNTQCIPRLFSALNNRSPARKHRSIYLSGSSKIIACVGEDSTSLSNHSDKKTATPQFPPGFWKDDIIESILSSNKVAVADEKRVETLISDIKSMFRGMGDGETNPSAYDTAWVAKIPALNGSDHPHFPQTLQWILENQLQDGSWGVEDHFLRYDRVLATLACLITLTLWRTGQIQVQKGLEFFKKHAEMMEDEADNHRPSGFEIVFPAMLNEAKQLCLDLPYELPFIKQIIKKGEAKLKRIPTDTLYTVPTIYLYYLEGLQEIVEWPKIIKLQSKDGSFLGSPASTAAVFMRTGNTKCLEFLNSVLMKFGNHVPCHYPLNLFERLWAVDTVERLGIDRHFKKEIQHALDYVYSHWNERGIGWARENPVADIDVTAMGLRILRLHGYNVSADVLKTFRDENGEFFRFSGQTERGVTDMLSLNRCSHVAIPGETVMEEAQLCTERYLWSALENVDAFDKWALKKNIRGEWEILVEAYTKEAEWSEAAYVPSFNEYIENATVSISLATIVLISVLFTGEVLTDHILSQIGHRSKFVYLMCLTGRLVNDTKSYQAERDRGEVASSIQCYMKDHPELLEEEALKHVYILLENALADLKGEFLNTKELPDNCRRLVFDNARSSQLFCMEEDGFTHSHETEIKEHVKKILFEPVA